jgi:endonuclease/exonuclease/phosphatase family metal-dependent hydrolase
MLSAIARKLTVRRLVAGFCAVAFVLIVAQGADRTPSRPAQGSHFAGTAAVSPSRGTFRVATFNIHSGVGADDVSDLSRTARCLEGFDVIGLNEVRAAPLTGSADQAAQLGQALGLRWLFAPAERQWWHDHFGNSVLCSLPVKDWQRVPLPGTRGKGFRNFVRVRVDVGDTPVTVLVTHLDRTVDREAQLKAVIAEFLQLPPPAILMGDLNTPASDPHLVALCRTPGVTDCLSQNGTATSENIDWIFVRGLECRAAGLRDAGASDHPLAWAEVSLARGSLRPR